MSGAHSILPPSGASTWRRCGLWVAMNQAYPQPDTPESMEGNAAHWVFAEMLAGRIVCEGLIAPNGVVVTEEMIEGGELVVETVRARMPVERFGPPRVEEAVAIPSIHAQCWGTPDIWAFSASPLVLEVVDYKFGHRFVDEYENDQGVAYITGIVDMLAEKFGKVRACSTSIAKLILRSFSRDASTRGRRFVLGRSWLRTFAPTLTSLPTRPGLPWRRIRQPLPIRNAWIAPAVMRARPCSKPRTTTRSSP